MSSPAPFLFYFPFNASFSGGAKSTLNLLRSIDSRVLRPIFVSQRESLLTEKARQYDVETHVVPFPDILDVYDGKTLEYGFIDKLRSVAALLRYNRRITEVARQSRARGIWTRNVKGVLLTGFAARWLGLPLVWDIGLEGKSQGMMRLLHWLGLTLATKVVPQAPSQVATTFDASASKLFANKFRPIRPGLDADLVEALQLPAEERGAGDNKQFDILSVGLISPRKNQFLLLQAANCLIERFPEIHVHIVGGIADDAYQARLERYVAQEEMSGHVSFLGHRDDVPRLMRQSDLFVLTSRNEGVPHVVREAMYAGLPVVATAVGGVPDIVCHRKTGFLAKDTKDVEQIAGCILHCIEDQERARTVARQGKRFVQETFSMQKWAASYNELLYELSSSEPHADRGQ